MAVEWQQIGTWIARLSAKGAIAARALERAA